jgi:exodeoxyribonuclease VII small subunit
MNNKPNYADAFSELQQIVREMEEGEIGVDDLSEKVKRAAELIRLCKNKLQHTEEDVQKILKELEGSNEEIRENKSEE